MPIVLKSGSYVLCLFSIILGGTGAWVVAHKGHELGLVDHPKERSSHYTPTPRGGGIGILVAFIFAALIIQVSVSFWLPVAFLALLSFFEDKLDLSPKFRLAFQFVAAIILLAGTGQFHLAHMNGLLLLIPMAVFAVGTANIYNFMDGINGIAAITGIVGFGLLTLFGLYSEGHHPFSALSICIALSCLGFLPFNMPKAKVFMGDVGSILLGFVFAAMVVIVSKNFLDFVCLASSLFPFYADELSTMAVRIRDGENLLRPHRRHVYQLLANEKGIAHWKVSVCYGLLQLLVGINVLMLKSFGGLVILSILAAYFGAFTAVSSVIRKSLITSA